jgi:dihydrofolate reductase
MPRKVIIYIASSVDGFIAGPGDNLDFLSIVHKEGEDYGYHAFISSVDTVIMGRRTYDWVTARVEFPHATKETYIFTRTPKPSQGNITFYSGDPVVLVSELKTRSGQHIFCDGGSAIIHLLLKAQLIDELIVSVVPILLGEGTPLFKEGLPGHKLQLLSLKSFDTGLIQLHYQVLN